MQCQPLGLGLRQIDPHRRPAGIQVTRPNQRRLRRYMVFSMVGWRQQTSRMSVLHRLCRRETPRIARSVYIWKVSNVIRSALVIVQVSKPYSKTDSTEALNAFIFRPKDKSCRLKILCFSWFNVIEAFPTRAEISFFAEVCGDEIPDQR